MSELNPENIDIERFIEYLEEKIKKFKATYGKDPKSIIVGPPEYMAMCAFATAIKMEETGERSVQRPLQFMNYPVIIKSTPGFDLGIDVEWVPGFVKKPSRIYRV